MSRPMRPPRGPLLREAHHRRFREAASTAVAGIRDPDRPYPAFPDGRPAPLRDGITFTEPFVPAISSNGASCSRGVQAEGTACGTPFGFYARHGSWTMEIGHRIFSGDDPWDGWMPDSVAFAIVTSKLLWHVCGGETLGHWPGLFDLSDEHVIDLHTWLCFYDNWQASDLRRMHNAILWEAARRRWPDGWWEDPSVVMEAK